MKTLQESILSRSSHGREGFKAQRRELIEKWLKENNIENYTINDDFTIDVDEGVSLFRKNLTEFPTYIQFGVVKGKFVCSFNHLSSLRGIPKEVGGNFDCSNNRLTSLEGAPKEINGYFDCSNNKLTTLKGGPVEVGGNFYCNDNKLTSLEGAPEKVGGYFNCNNNSVQFTKDAVREVCNVKGSINC